MTDAEVIENACENERELGDEFEGTPLPDDRAAFRELGPLVRS